MRNLDALASCEVSIRIDRHHVKAVRAVLPIDEIANEDELVLIDSSLELRTAGRFTFPFEPAANVIVVLTQLDAVAHKALPCLDLCPDM